MFWKKKKIALVANSLLVFAGVERATYEWAVHLKKQGFDVHLIILRKIGKAVDRYKPWDIPVTYIPIYEYTDRPRVFYFVFLKFYLFLLFQRFRAIVSVQAPANHFTRLAAFPPLGRRILAIECMTLYGRGRKAVFLDRLLAKWTDRIICVSKMVQEEVLAENIAREKTCIIEYGVRIEPGIQSQQTLREKINNRFVYGYMGLLTERKRPSLLLDAFCEVLKKHPDSVLLFVGGGEEEQALKEKALTIPGLRDAVLFAGEQLHPHDFYPLFDVFVFPSVLEGFGMVWVEAMMHRLPVICSDIRPMCDYIKHRDNGLLFPPDNQPALVAAMMEMRDSQQLREQLSQRGHDFAYAHFEQNQQFQKMVDLIV
jgi:glycosyltransferase involved in cell wall biosynthesis